MTRFLLCSLLLAFYSIKAKAQFGTPDTILKNEYKGIPVAIDKGDFNQDGFEDVFIAFANGLYWWPNNGNNGFSDPIQLSNPPADSTVGGWTITNMITADLDQDGNKDVACVVNCVIVPTSGLQETFTSLGPGPIIPPPMPEQGRILIYKGFGNGVFSEGKFIAKNFGHLSAIRAGNLNTSQTLEIVATSLQSTTASFGDTIVPFGFNNLPGKIAIYSDISFEDTLLATETILSESAIQGSNVELGDIENDGDLDVFFSSSFNGFAGWFENLGNDSYGPKQWITQASGHQLSYFKLADLNGDSLIDFIYNKINDGCYWQRNFGAGQFGNPISFENSTAGHFNTDDIDDDGDIDIIGAAYGITLFENNVNGSSFNIHSLDYKTTGGLWSCTLDINNDGVKEIVVSEDPEYGTLSLYQKNNEGNWNNRLVLSPQLVNVQNVIAADIDGDGDQDIIAGSLIDDKLVFFENMGAGVFSYARIISYSIMNLKDICVADVDNDLDLDIIAASLADSNIQLFRNNGFGGFQNPEIIASQLFSAARITAVDIDQDGNMDIVGTFSFGLYSTYRKVYSIRNAGNGIFEQAQLVADSVSWGSELLITADLNQDQFPDLISASSTALVWMKSFGNGLFDTVSVISNQFSNIKDVKPTYNHQNQRIDLLVAAIGASQTPNYFVRFENTGGGVFAPLDVLVPSEPTWRGVAIEPMDFDLDNDEDIVVYARETPTNTFKHALLLNDDAANFAAPDTFLPFNSGGYSTNFIHADLNDDAYPDLIRFSVSNIQDVSIQWQANIGGISTSIEKPVGEFSVYPNPNKGRFYIQQLNEIDKGSVNVFSLDGRMVNCNISYSSNQTEISVNAEAGIYILSWISNNKKEFRKVIIQE